MVEEVQARTLDDFAKTRVIENAASLLMLTSVHRDQTIKVVTYLAVGLLGCASALVIASATAGFKIFCAAAFVACAALALVALKSLSGFTGPCAFFRMDDPDPDTEAALIGFEFRQIGYYIEGVNARGLRMRVLNRLGLAALALTLLSGAQLFIEFLLH